MLSKTKMRKRRIYVFLIAFLLSTVVAIVAVVAIGGYWLNRTVIVPPAIPQMPTNPVNSLVINPPERTDEYGEPEEPQQETPWYFGLVAPERFTDDVRRYRFFTFMIIGLNEGRNANTVMVASYDYFNKEANIISIPRDSLIDTTRNGRKLGSSYIAGSGGGRGRAGGIAALQRDIMTVIGFIPDFYVIIDYDAFFAIVDAIGGIEIYVPFHMRYDDPWQDLHIDIPAGLQHMNAETALQFSRFRRSNRGYRSVTDYARIENQQAVINAVIAQLLRPENLLRVLDFVDIFHNSVDTNLEVGNMMWFARELSHIRGTDALSSYTTPMLGSSREPMWYELLDARGIVELVNRTVNPFTRDIELRDVSIIRE